MDTLTFSRMSDDPQRPFCGDSFRVGQCDVESGCFRPFSEKDADVLVGYTIEQVRVTPHQSSRKVED
ncbi:MAG: hypothetical protein ACLUE2_08890 [Bacteroides cellulosilyticus]